MDCRELREQRRLRFPVICMSLQKRETSPTTPNVLTRFSGSNTSKTSVSSAGDKAFEVILEDISVGKDVRFVTVEINPAETRSMLPISRLPSDPWRYPD